MTAVAAIYIIVALVGNMLADDTTLSTLPISLQFASAVVTTLPASFYMKRVGRQLGFITLAGRSSISV